MQATDKFQGKCLVNTNGSRWMAQFDHMPPAARDRLRQSPFNICAECVLQEASNQSMLSYDDFIADDHYLKAIDQIEAQIRAEETTER